MEKLFHDQSPRKYGTGPGSNSRPLHAPVARHVTDCATRPGCIGDMSRDMGLPTMRYVVTWEYQQLGMCDQQWLRPACAYAQSDQSLC